MRTDTRREQGSDDESLRQIPLWAGRYAQNRTLPVVVGQIIFLLGFLAFAGLGSLVAWSHLRGLWWLTIVSGMALGMLTAWWMWFSFLGGARIMQRITDRLYRGEGWVQAQSQPEASARRVGWVAGIVFGLCIGVSVALGLAGLIPIRYMQPVSALYVVPFLIYLGLRQREAGWPLMLIWPALYALHALLLTLGAPIYFSDPYDALNMLVPVVVYGLFAALVAHLYSRLALRRLRALSRGPEAGGGGEA